MQNNYSNFYFSNRQLISSAIKNCLANNDIYLIGFLRKIRKLGKLVFVNLVDTSGDLQLVFTDNLAEEIQKITKESIIGVQGKIVPRKNINHDQVNGQWEMLVNEWVLINEAKKMTPFVIDHEIVAKEDTKLKYRYLELRSNLANRIKDRSKIINLFRSFLLKEGFVEVETPILGRSTPEGARDYLVPTRTKSNPAGFALPQSPQLYKQLLMIGGLEKYFQIAKNFRDEDLRADRQPEFTQLDLEWSYTNTSILFELVEKMFGYVWKHFYNQELSIPFLQISYQTAIEKYGTDKPDLRFDLKIEDHTSAFMNSELKIFESLKKPGYFVKGLFLPEIILNKTLIDKFTTEAQNFGLKGLLIANKQGDQYQGMLHKIDPEWVKNYFQNKGRDGTIILVCDQYHLTQPVLGHIRLWIAKEFELIDQNQYQFLWVIDWPLFEYDHDNQQWIFAHNPFTQPKDSLTTNLSKIKANAYDLVLNGTELGSGSARIYDSEIQAQMFAAVGWDTATINNKFGWFIDAFNYGVPPHQGIGLGLDRIIQLMLKTSTIRDVIAFPKSNKGTDLMQSTPDHFDDEQLAIVGLKKLSERK